MIDRARAEAITVKRYGRAAAVIISPETYEHFEKLEDAYWAARIEERRTTVGYLSNDESLAAIKALLAVR